MYPATKTNSMTEEEARNLVGDKAVDAVLSINCEFTNRVIEDCYGVYEMSASVEVGDETITVLYLVDKDECDATEDLGSLDYDDYTFVIE